ncbi:TPA: UvrD-helicase domain-containing protein [Proteus mirabilis]|nr:UvrD-helicase domain-containing protein [Proteus mirabilis]
MINIEIAGAGAGKTYGLARRIINSYNTNSSKTIYALTYTNAAKENISKEIIKQYKNIPDKIKVVTIHDFLINQIIIPYAHLVTEYHIISKFIFCQENKNKNYAILLDFIESLINNKEKTSKVLSIDKSKGLESDNVYFILSNSTLNYIKDAISNKTPKNKKHNKEWNKVYVALTRTKNKLTFVLDERLINENNITSFTNTINHYI